MTTPVDVTMLRIAADCILALVLLGNLVVEWDRLDERVYDFRQKRLLRKKALRQSKTPTSESANNGGVLSIDGSKDKTPPNAA